MRLFFVVGIFIMLINLSCNRNRGSEEKESCDTILIMPVPEEELPAVAVQNDSATQERCSKEIIDSLANLIEKRCKEIEVIRNVYGGYVINDNPPYIMVSFTNYTDTVYKTFYKEVTNHPLVRTVGIDFGNSEPLDSNRVKMEIEEMLREAKCN